MQTFFSYCIACCQRVKTLPPAATQGGQAVIIAVVFFLTALIVVVTGVVIPVLTETRNIFGNIRSKESFYLAEGSLEDVIYRTQEGVTVDDNEFLSEPISGGGLTASTTRNVISANEIEITSAGDSAQAIRKTKARLIIGTSAAFNFGVQSGSGGFILDNTSSVIGNAYSNGPIVAGVGAGQNLINGTAVSAGPAGLIDDIHVAQDAYAREIRDSEVGTLGVGGDAYYDTLFSGTVHGTAYSGQPDQPLTTLPIPDTIVTQWEADAVAGGIDTTCPHTIVTDVTIGPKKIECDVTINDDVIVTLTGVVWVEGNLTIKKPTIKIDPLLVDTSVGIIVHDPSDELTGSKVILQNTSTFVGAAGDSYVLVLSMNKSAEMAGSEVAIDIQQQVDGDLLVYAGHGEVLMSQSATLKEVTGYKVHLENSAKAIYDTGLGSLLFVSSPSEGFHIDQWNEVQ
jgi:hypothetical protein